MRELYQELIIDHGKRPRNFRKIDDPTHCQTGHNPLCGDRLDLFIQCQHDVLDDVAFQGEGCAICMASASLMSQALKGQSKAHALNLFEAFYTALMGDDESQDVGALGKLEALLGVSQYPTRVKCATLAWHTMKAALEQASTTVSTE